jgi:predicted nucleic acid-binding protein
VVGRADLRRHVVLVRLRRLRDPNHHSARSLVERHHGERLLTTNHVRGETWTLTNRRESHAAAVRFLDALAASPRLRVLQVAESQRQPL